MIMNNKLGLQDRRMHSIHFKTSHHSKLKISPQKFYLCSDETKSSTSDENKAG